MPHYQVSLYKDLLSSDGHPFHCLQAVVEVDAEAPDRAIGLVLKDMRGPRDWSIEVCERAAGLIRRESAGREASLGRHDQNDRHAASGYRPRPRRVDDDCEPTSPT